MRELTFKGFLFNYVRELSYCKSNCLSKLANESRSDNPRLREPLLLYALFSHDWDTIVRLCRADSALINDYNSYFKEYKNSENLLKAFESNDYHLPLGYLKVYKSYIYQKSKYFNDNHTKALMREKIKKLQEQKKVSSYRVYTDLKLNSGNYNAFLKHNQLDKLSLNNVRNTLKYFQKYQ